jgi:hypothetical protein
MDCCEENLIVPSVYWDLFSILVLVMGPKKHSGKEGADTSFASQRTKTTNFENDLTASMLHEKPASLDGMPDGEMVEQDTGFSACSS